VKKAFLLWRNLIHSLCFHEFTGAYIILFAKEVIGGGDPRQNLSFQYRRAIQHLICPESVRKWRAEGHIRQGSIWRWAIPGGDPARPIQDRSQGEGFPSSLGPGSYLIAEPLAELARLSLSSATSPAGRLGRRDSIIRPPRGYNRDVMMQVTRT